MRRTLILTAGIILCLAVCVSCDPWSTYPPDDRYGGYKQDGSQSLEWTQVTQRSGWTARYKHASTVFDGSLWVLGGKGYQGLARDSYLEDVWYSSDGIEWECATTDAPWHGRTGHAVVTLADKMLLIGGYAVDEAAESDHETNHYTNDVWESSDGINWTKLTDAPFGKRAYHAAVVIDVSGTDTLFVIGGRKDGSFYYDDIWRSTDGSSWTQVALDATSRTLLGKRAAMATSVMDGKIYIQGGYAPDFQVAQVDAEDWEKIRVFDPVSSSVTRGANGIAFPYRNRAHMEMIPFGGRLLLFSGVDIKRENDIGYRETYSTWSYSPDVWSLESDGSGFGSRYGYTAELFDAGAGEEIWILGGWSYWGPEDDVWTAREAD